MNIKVKIILFIVVFFGVMLCTILVVDPSLISVLNPKGIIALKQRNLIVITTLLMLIVVVPVFIMTCYFSWKYRADNTKAKYTPEADRHLGIEIAWWSIPFAIVIVLGVITWKSCLDLDPFKPVETGAKPIKIQVVALQWKWLFIYPEQQIATVNFVQFPEKTPIIFEITADAPMNSFWIPQLGGQIFAMSGMRTKLNIAADTVGEYRGSSANISGRGFAGMTFMAKSTSGEDFNSWVQSVKKSSSGLNLESYNQLAVPSSYIPPAYYSLRTVDLFDRIVMKYMAPMSHSSHKEETLNY